jgi:hypothetical protein
VIIAGGCYARVRGIFGAKTEGTTEVPLLWSFETARTDTGAQASMDTVKWPARRTVTATVLFILLALSLYGYGRYTLHRRHDRIDRVQAEARDRALALQKEIDAAFPVGSSEEGMIVALKKSAHLPHRDLMEFWHGGQHHEFAIIVDEVPIDTWICDRTATLLLSANFEAGRLSATRVWMMPHGCL